jgi:hypothetical protein
MVGCIVWLVGMGLTLSLALHGRWIEAICAFVVTAFIVSLAAQDDERGYWREP